MMRGQKRGCKRHWEPNEYGQPLKPLNYYAKLGIKPYAPGQPKLEEEIYTSEQDFIEKQTQLIKQFRRPEFVTGASGRRRLRYKPFRPVTSDSWKIYQQQMQSFEEVQSLSSDERDLVAESLLGDKDDGGPKDESLGTAAKKKSQKKTLDDKKKRKSIVLSPGRISTKIMKMGRNVDDITQDKKLVKRVVKEELKKELKTLERKLKSYINRVQTRKSLV